MLDTAPNDPDRVIRFTDTAGNIFEELIPQTSRALYQKALNGTCSPRQAIKAFCLRCVGYLRADVSNCTATHCPLHRYRPFQKGAADPDGDDLSP